MHHGCIRLTGLTRHKVFETVAAHKYAVRELLQLKTNADLVQYAIKHRIIPL